MLIITNRLELIAVEIKYHMKHAISVLVVHFVYTKKEEMIGKVNNKLIAYNLDTPIDKFYLR